MQVQPTHSTRSDPTALVPPNVLTNYRELYARHFAAHGHPYTGDDVALSNHIHNVGTLPSSEQTDLWVLYEMRHTQLIAGDLGINVLLAKIGEVEKAQGA
jgi:hypothetical protein